MTQIEVQTTRFGAITVEDTGILAFEKPILGFEGLKRFVILDHAENSPFKWLQSLEEPDLAFVITNPTLFGIDFEFVLPQDFADQLNIKTVEDALVVTIVNIPQGNPGEMTANLLGPIVINPNTMRAMQVVLSDSEYSSKTRLITDDALKKQSSASVALDKGD